MRLQSQSVRTVRLIKIGNSQGANKTEWRTSRMGEEMSIVVGIRWAQIAEFILCLAPRWWVPPRSDLLKNSP